jgi:Tfp pilus assembly protein PilF
MGDYAKGEAELESFLEKNPEDAHANNDLGYLYAEQGKNLEKAEVMIRKALQEEAENSAYLDSLGWVLFKRGKVKEAVEPLEKAVQKLSEVSSSDATIFEHLGDVYFQLKENGKAKTAWKSAEKAALKSTPPDKRLPEIRKKLDALDKLGPVPKPSTGNTP